MLTQLRTLSCPPGPRGQSSASDALTGPGPETLSKSMVMRFGERGCVFGVKRDEAMTQRSNEDFGCREENRERERIYLERCTKHKGATTVSADSVSTSVMSLKTKSIEEVESDAIQVGLAWTMRPMIARRQKCGRNHWSSTLLSLASRQTPSITAVILLSF